MSNAHPNKVISGTRNYERHRAIVHNGQHLIPSKAIKTRCRLGCGTAAAMVAKEAEARKGQDSDLFSFIRYQENCQVGS